MQYRPTGHLHRRNVCLKLLDFALLLKKTTHLYQGHAVCCKKSATKIVVIVWPDDIWVFPPCLAHGRLGGWLACCCLLLTLMRWDIQHKLLWQVIYKNPQNFCRLKKVICTAVTSCLCVYIWRDFFSKCVRSTLTEFQKQIKILLTGLNATLSKLASRIWHVRI